MVVCFLYNYLTLVCFLYDSSRLAHHGRTTDHGPRARRQIIKGLRDLDLSRAQQDHTPLCGAQSPLAKVPGRSPCIHIYVGPAGPHAKDPGGSTNMHIYVGPGGPYAKDPGRSTNIHRYVGPKCSYAKDPGRSTNIYIYVGPALTPGTPGVSANLHMYLGPGGPPARDLGNSTHIHIYLRLKGPYADDPGRSAHTGARTPRTPGGQQCGAQWARTSRTPGGQESYTFLWGPGGRTPGTPYLYL